MKRFLTKNWPFLLVSFHFIKMAFFFRKLDFSSSLPFVNIDYVQFYARVLRAHFFFQDTGNFWGYDPYDMAGYISGPFLSVGTHILSLLCHSLSWIMPISTSLLFFEILSFIFVPFLFIPIVRNFHGNKNEAWMAFGIISLFFGCIDPFSDTYLNIGLFGFLIACFFSLWQVSLVYKWMNKPDRKTWILLTLATSLIFQFHSAALLIVLVPNIVLYALFFKRIKRSQHGFLWVAVAIVFLTNWYWIHPFVQYSEWRGFAPYFVPKGWAGLWAYFNPIQPNLFAYVRSLWLIGVTFLASLTLYKVFGKKKKFQVLMLSWLFTLVLLSFFGHYFPVIKTLQTGRNIFALWLLIYVLASYSLGKYLFKKNGFQPFLISLIVLTAAFNFMHLKSKASSRFPALINRLPSHQEELIDYIRTKGPFPGRMLIESADRPEPHFLEIIPILTKQPIVGGPHPGNFIMGGFTVFSGRWWNGNQLVFEPIFFKKPFNSLDEKIIREYLDLYNIKTVTARSPAVIKTLNKHQKTFSLLERVGIYSVYQVKSDSTWFHAGKGDLAFDYNKITIQDPSQGKSILKFHWIKTFKSDPPLAIEPVLLMDDPYPFIAFEIKEPIKKLTLTHTGL